MQGRIDQGILSDGGEVADLGGLPCRGAAELGGEEAGDLGGGRGRGAGVEEERAGAAGGGGGQPPRPPPARRAGGAGAAGEDVVDRPRHLVARGAGDGSGGDRQAGRVVWRGVVAVDREFGGDALAVVEAGEGGGVVDGVLGHLAVRRPLAAGDREDA